MKDIINTVAVISLVLASHSAIAEEKKEAPGVDEFRQMLHDRRGVIMTHDAIEAESLRISLGDDLNGFVEGRVCDQCDTIRVRITPATKAYEGGVQVPLKRAAGRVGQYATVIYEIDTKNVSEIRW